MESALIVLRKSRGATRDDQDPDVLAKHRRNMVRLCESKGLKYDILEDVVSGALSHEPGQILDQALEMFARGDYSCVACEDIDRLARPDMETSGRILNTLLRHQVRIITPYTTYDPSNPDDVQQLKFKFFFADLELSAYKRRTHRARDTARRTMGVYPNGHAPLGYRWRPESKSYEPDEYYPLVEWIFRHVVSEGAHLLVKEIRERFGLTLRPNMISHIVNNPFYAGYPCQRRRTDFDGHEQRLPESEWVWPERPGDYPTPVTLEQWKAIRALRAERLSKRTKPRSGYWAGGVLRCPICGSALVGTYDQYRCRGQRQGSDCAFGTMSADVAHRTLYAWIREVAQLAVIQDGVVDQLVSDVTERQSRRHSLENELSRIQSHIAETEKRRERLLDLYLDQEPGANAKQLYESKESELRAELLIAREEHQRLEALLRLPAVDPGVVETFRTIAANIDEVWGVLTSEEKRMVCGLIIKRVEIGMQPRMVKNGQKGWSKEVRVLALHEPFAPLLERQA